MIAVSSALGLALAWAYSAPPLRLKENGWWGNALNPRDTRLQALPRSSELAGGYELDGLKGFCSGTRGSHYLTVSACVAGHAQPVLGLLETASPGIAVKDDWNPMGQRQTDSATVQFRHVQVSEDEVLAAKPTAEWDAKVPQSGPTVERVVRQVYQELKGAR